MQNIEKIAKKKKWLKKHEGRKEEKKFGELVNKK